MSAALDYLADKVAKYKTKYDNFKYINKVVADVHDSYVKNGNVCIAIGFEGHGLQITGSEALQLIELIKEQNIEAGIELAKLNSTLQHVNRTLNAAEEGEQHEEE